MSAPVAFDPAGGSDSRGGSDHVRRTNRCAPRGRRGSRSPPVSSPSGTCCGLATDPRIDLDTAPVSSVMSAPVQAMGGDEMVYRALGRMDRLGVRHLCVADASGAAIGMVSQRDLLHHRARAAAELGDAVACADDAAALAAAHSPASPRRGRIGGGGSERKPTPRGSSRTRSGHSPARLPRLRGSGSKARGAAPRRRPGACWCSDRAAAARVCSRPIRTTRFVHAGSEQDGCVVCSARIPHGGPARRGRGAPLPGRNHGVEPRMAGQHAGLARARRRLASALESGGPASTSTSSTTSCRWRAPPSSAASCTMPRSTRRDGRHRSWRCSPSRSPPSRRRSVCSDRLRATDGRVDLKIGGLLPLVGIARTLALRIGSQARSTPERIQDAGAAGRISPSDAETLVRIHRSLLTLTLEQQLEDLAAGVPPSGRIELRRLSPHRAESARSRSAYAGRHPQRVAFFDCAVRFRVDSDFDRMAGRKTGATFAQPRSSPDLSMPRCPWVRQHPGRCESRSSCLPSCDAAAGPSGGVSRLVLAPEVAAEGEESVTPPQDGGAPARGRDG